MRRSNVRFLSRAALGLLLVAFVSLPAHVAAEQPGISVTPAQLEFSLRSEAPSQASRELTISNSYDTDVRLTAELQAIDESSARLVPSGPLDETFARAIKLSATDIMVPAGGSYRLRIAIDGTLLSGGGHYATVVLTQSSTAGGSSDFLSAIAVSLFVVKNENIHTNLRLVSTSIGHTTFSLPTSGSITFRNLGNTHVVPRASISIYDDKELVSKAVLNQNSVPLFPNQQATVTGKFETYKRFLLPKRLRVVTVYRIDGSDILLTKEQTFLHIPFVTVAMIAAAGGVLWLSRRHILRGLYRMQRGSVKPKWPKNRHRASAAPTVEHAGDDERKSKHLLTTKTTGVRKSAAKPIPIKVVGESAPHKDPAQNGE